MKQGLKQFTQSLASLNVGQLWIAQRFPSHVKLLTAHALS
jgi:hypothetical protein